MQHIVVCSLRASSAVQLFDNSQKLKLGSVRANLWRGISKVVEVQRGDPKRQHVTLKMDFGTRTLVKDTHRDVSGTASILSNSVE